MYYLYVKTHNVTGLKYLGYTGSKDPFSYPGSGTRWRRHLNKYGYNYTTTILAECQSKIEIQIIGTYYSKLWNVVLKTQWANIKEETADGGDTSMSVRFKEGIKNRNLSGKNNPMYGRSAVKEQNLKWYTNGETNVYVTKGTEPIGFYQGRSNLKRSPCSEETKKKISQSKLRKKCVGPDGTIYESRNQAALIHGLTPEGIGRRCKTNYCGWRYL